MIRSLNPLSQFRFAFTLLADEFETNALCCHATQNVRNRGKVTAFLTNRANIHSQQHCSYLQFVENLLAGQDPLNQAQINHGTDKANNIFMLAPQQTEAW
jgi:hypothetical protein